MEDNNKVSELEARIRKGEMKVEEKRDLISKIETQMKSHSVGSGCDESDNIACELKDLKKNKRNMLNIFKKLEGHKSELNKLNEIKVICGELSDRVEDDGEMIDMIDSMTDKLNYIITGKSSEINEIGKEINEKTLDLNERESKLEQLLNSKVENVSENETLDRKFEIYKSMARNTTGNNNEYSKLEEEYNKQKDELTKWIVALEGLKEKLFEVKGKI